MTADRTEPTTTGDHTEPYAAATDPVGPAEVADRIGPAQSADRIGPAQSADRAGPARSSDRIGPPLATDRTGTDVIRRIPPLLRVVLVWACAVPVTALVRSFFDFADPWPEKLLDAASVSLVMAPAVLVSAQLAGHMPADERALRRAVRHGTPPDDDRLRAALPDHLAWLRRGARRGLAVGLPLVAVLIAVGWYGGVDRWWWTSCFALVAVLLTGFAVDGLRRVRRLERRLAGQRG